MSEVVRCVELSGGVLETPTEAEPQGTTGLTATGEGEGPARGSEESDDALLDRIDLEATIRGRAWATAPQPHKPLFEAGVVTYSSAFRYQGQRNAAAFATSRRCNELAQAAAVDEAVKRQTRREGWRRLHLSDLSPPEEAVLYCPPSRPKLTVRALRLGGGEGEGEGEGGAEAGGGAGGGEGEGEGEGEGGSGGGGGGGTEGEAGEQQAVDVNEGAALATEQTAAAATPPPSDTLPANCSLGAGEFLLSASGRYKAIMQADGNCGSGRWSGQGWPRR